MNKINKTISFISRIVVGVIFIYSGFVKGIDPLGSFYKFSDYFTAFGTPWAIPFSFGLGILLAIAEFTIGFAVLLNLKIRWSSLGALIFMIIFTPLTLYLAIKNPVHDCGCFGDALVITNWQTFYKNLVLLVPIVFLFVTRKKQENRLSCAEQWILSGVFASILGFFAWYSYNHLPVLDFRPYKVGTYIPDGMTIPEGAPADVWESTFIYSKNGKEQKFDVKNLPDSTWKFVDAKHQLIKKGYEPPIHDFTISSSDGNEITDIVLSSDNYNFLMVSYNLEKADRSKIDKLNEIADYCNQKGFSFYCLTSSTDDDIARFAEETGAHYDFYNTDEITLKTMIRSNPGLILLKEGTIVDKWHYNDLPDPLKLDDTLLQQSISKYAKKMDQYYILTLILFGIVLIGGYLSVQKWITSKSAKYKNNSME